MSTHVDTGIEGRIGVIALNRPEAINALTAPMVATISATLAAWRDDPRVRAVLFEGRGPRGFCSGGDVRRVREWVMSADSADHDTMRAFFSDEYAMNLVIATYPKPIVALVDGICMGGGIGLAGHAGFRFATERARFAMPEAGIGLFCDIGVNALLAKAPPARALLLELTGQPVGAADALALGLTDAVVSLEALPGIRDAVIAAGDAGDFETAVVAIMQASSIEPGEAAFCALADRLENALLAESAEEIVAAIAARAAEDAEIAAVSATIGGRCPTSLVANVENYRAALKAPEVASVLAADTRLAHYLAPRGDFIEGVRAVLVDKGSMPAWSPAAIADVDVAALRAVIAG